MRRRVVYLVGVALAAGLFVSTVLVGPASAARLASLTGAKEVPGPGDPNGKGRARITFYPAQKKICFRVSWSNIRNPNAAHIHKGGPGVAGPVVVELFARKIKARDYVTGCKPATKKTIRAIKRRPRRWYVNVHNKPYPDGAIRGQLKRPG